jgi:hypothetical protein
MPSQGTSRTLQQLLDFLADGPIGTYQVTSFLRDFVASMGGVGLGPGGVQISPSFLNMTLTGLLFESNTAAVVAFAGGGQANATALTTELNRITTVATAGDSVKLPAAAVGLTIFVMNKGANSVQVFGTGTDQVDGQAAATGVSQMVNSLVLYSCTVAGQWDSQGLATGYAGSLETYSSVNGLVAFAGGGQANGTPITAMMNRFVTVATAADSGKLPAAVLGLSIVVINAAAANSMNVFPATGDQINALGANAAFALAAGKTATFYCVNAGQWHTILTA